MILGVSLIILHFYFYAHNGAFVFEHSLIHRADYAIILNINYPITLFNLITFCF